MISLKDTKMGMVVCLSMRSWHKCVLCPPPLNSPASTPAHRVAKLRYTLRHKSTDIITPRTYVKGTAIGFVYSLSLSSSLK